MNNKHFLDSSKREHGVLGYEVSATQHIEPFCNGWYIRAFSNVYSLNDMRISIRHYYGIGGMARWTVIYKYRTDTHYTVEVYDSVQVKGEFYDRTVYRNFAYDLKEAVHLVNTHKSDK